VIANKNIKIYKLNNEWHGFSWIHRFVIGYIYLVGSAYNTEVELGDLT